VTDNSYFDVIAIKLNFIGTFYDKENILRSFDKGDYLFVDLKYNNQTIISEGELKTFMKYMGRTYDKVLVK